MKYALKIFFLHLFFAVSGFSFAQTPDIDSLKKVLSSLPKPTGKLSDSTYIITAQQIALEYSHINPDTAITLAQKDFQLSEKIQWKNGKVICLNTLGWSNYVKGSYPQALEYYNTGLRIAEEISDKNIQATLLGNIGVVYWHQSDYPKALEYFLKALKIFEELGNKKEIARHLSRIGVVYAAQHDYPNALAYFLKALKIDEDLGNNNGIARNLGNIGNVYLDQSDYPKALEYYFKILKIFDKLGDKIGMARGFSNVGLAYAGQSDYPKALVYYLKALKIHEELGEKRSLAEDFGLIGDVYRKTGKFKESEKYLKLALALSDSLGTLDLTRDNEFRLSQLYDTLSQYKHSLVHYKKYIAARDTIDNNEKRKKINYLANKYEWEKKEALINAEREEERALFEANQRRNRIIIISVTAGMIMFAVFLVFVYRSLQTTRKQKNIIELQKQVVEKQKLEVEKQKEIVEQQKAQVEAQKKIIEDKNKNIMDSIRYAKRIQSAVLPPDKLVQQLLPQSFIFYKPKDIVAGDFYWLESKNNRVFFAACDCTGHGVPGAMVSVVCVNGLNRSVREHNITEAGKILDKTREIVIAEFEKSEEEVNDGMDISLCVLQGNQLQWAGANNPLWLVRNGELIEYKANRQPIGKTDNPLPFTTQHIEVQAGDSLYLFSDGYADQFGGEQDRKFKSANFKKLILSIQHLSMERQKEQINQAFEEWKTGYEQIDDVLVIGVKV